MPALFWLLGEMIIHHQSFAGRPILRHNHSQLDITRWYVLYMDQPVKQLIGNVPTWKHIPLPLSRSTCYSLDMSLVHGCLAAERLSPQKKRVVENPLESKMGTGRSWVPIVPILRSQNGLFQSLPLSAQHDKFDKFRAALCGPILSPRCIHIRHVSKCWSLLW